MTSAPTTPREVGLLRLVAQGLVGVEPGTSPVDVVRRLGAVQGQDLPGALVSVALRTSDRSRAQVVAALDAAQVVRTWPMRGTLHLVAAEDVGWLLATTAVRQLPQLQVRRMALGLDDVTLARAADVAGTALDEVRPGGLRRSDLMRAWEDAGVPTSEQRGYHLIVQLAHSGMLSLGPTAGTEQLFVRTSDWLTPGPLPDPDEALAELARRYLRGHGPATVHDLARWSGVTVGQARTGVAQVQADLLALDVAGVEHWLDPAVPDRLAGCRREAGQVLLLPGFDEYLLGYADRSAVLPDEHAQRIAPGRNGVFRPTVVDGGQVVGTWRHVAAGRTGPATVDVEPFGTLRRGVAARVERAHARLP